VQEEDDSLEAHLRKLVLKSKQNEERYIDLQNKLETVLWSLDASGVGLESTSRVERMEHVIFDQTALI